MTYRPRSLVPLLFTAGLLFSVAPGEVQATKGINAAYLEYQGTTALWSTDDPNFRKCFVELDVEARRIRYRPIPADPDQGGDMEITWNAFPQFIREGEAVSAKFGGRLIAAPRAGLGVSISIGSQPADFFRHTPPGRVGQYVGRTGYGNLSEGRQQVKIEPGRIANVAVGSMVSIYFVINEFTVFYNYRVVHPAPVAPVDVSRGQTSGGGPQPQVPRSGRPPVNVAPPIPGQTGDPETAISRLFQLLGGEGGALDHRQGGYQEYGPSVAGTMGFAQAFSGGRIIYHRTGPKAGMAFEMHSWIFNAWEGSGGRQTLGFPISNEADTTPSPQGTKGRFNLFENGVIIMHADGYFRGNVYVLQGAIATLYQSMGGTGSWLGMPLSHEEDWNGGKRTKFEGGVIIWTQGGGARAVREGTPAR